MTKGRKPTNHLATKILAYIPPDIKEGVRQLGEENDRNLTQEVNRALRFWLIDHNALPPAKPESK